MAGSLKLGVIGAGAIGQLHIEGLLKHPQAEVIALAEVNPDRRTEAATKYKIAKTYEDHKELLKDKSVEAVTIAVPNYLHAQVAIDCLKAGKHVLLEKPFATSAAEAQQVLDAWQDKQKVFMIGQNFRFMRDTQMVHDYARRGEFGDIYHARCYWLRRAGIPRIGSWFTQKKYAGGGCCYDIGVHLLDATLHVMGTFDAEAVSGLTFAKFGPRGLGNGDWGLGEINPDKPFDVEDLAVAMIKLKGGRSVVLEISWAIHADGNPKDYGIDFYGTEAGASLYPARIHKVKGTNFETTTPDFKVLPLPEERMVHFVDCVVKKIPPVVKPEESLKVQKILDGIYESSKSGREVRI